MTIEILNLTRTTIVEFSTGIGIGIATCSRKGIKKGERYYVEFDINQMFKIGHDASINSEKQFSISHIGDENEIQGMVELIDEDGLFYLRLAMDSIIMIEDSEKQFKVGDYITLKVKADNFVLTLPKV